MNPLRGSSVLSTMATVVAAATLAVGATVALALAVAFRAVATKMDHLRARLKTGG